MDVWGQFTSDGDREPLPALGNIVFLSENSHSDGCNTGPRAPGTRFQAHRCGSCAAHPLWEHPPEETEGGSAVWDVAGLRGQAGDGPPKSPLLGLVPPGKWGRKMNSGLRAAGGSAQSGGHPGVFPRLKPTGLFLKQQQCRGVSGSGGSGRCHLTAVILWKRVLPSGWACTPDPDRESTPCWGAPQQERGGPGHSGGNAQEPRPPYPCVPQNVPNKPCRTWELPPTSALNCAFPESDSM